MFYLVSCFNHYIQVHSFRDGGLLCHARGFVPTANIRIKGDKSTKGEQSSIGNGSSSIKAC